MMKKPKNLKEQTSTPSPSPVHLPKAYFMLGDLKELVVHTMQELAPNGVGSQSEYRSLLSQALDQVQDDLEKKIANSKVIESIILSLAQVERELGKMPFETVLDSI